MFHLQGVWNGFVQRVDMCKKLSRMQFIHICTKFVVAVSVGLCAGYTCEVKRKSDLSFMFQ